MVHTAPDICAYSPPTPLAPAIDQIEAWLEAPGLIILSEVDGY